MKHLMLRSLVLPTALCGAAGGSMATAPADASLAERAGRVMSEVASQAHFNGAVVLMRDGQIVYEHAVGLAQRKPDRAFSTRTPSDGASLAKTMTAALIHELVAEGRLSLDDPVTRHLPHYPYAQHTLHDLVSHRSGLPDYDFFEADFRPDQARDTADLLTALARRQPAPRLAPGVQVEYSNLGFDLAALIAEGVTGQKIATLYRERYLKPLGMGSHLTRLSWYCDAQQQRCHYTGAYSGFFAQVYWDLGRREVLAYVSNSTLPPWRCAMLTRDLIHALAGQAAQPDTAPKPVRINKQDLRRWAGAYSAPGFGALQIITQADRAFVRVGGGELASLFPAAPGVLYAPTLDLWLAFSGTPDNATLHLRSVFDQTDAKRLADSGNKP